MSEAAAANSSNLPSTRTSSSRRSRPASTTSNASQRPSSRTSDESTPLLARANSADREDAHQSDEEPDAASSLLRSLRRRTSRGKTRWPWPSILALLLLFVFTLSIMLIGFFIPQGMEDYFMQAKEVDITSVSLPDITETGANVRIQGVIWMDASKVRRKTLQNLGIFATFFVRSVKTKDFRVEVTLPDYGGVLAGTATVPPMELHIRNQQKNHIDTLIHLEPGNLDSVRQVANDWLNGQLQQLRVEGKAEVKLKSGIFRLPTQNIVQTLTLESNNIPAIPAYKISRLDIHEANLTDGTQVMQAEVSATVQNDYPIELTAPSVKFAILVEGCLPEDPLIKFADATMASAQILPRQGVPVDATGVVRKLPESLTAACPGSDRSPLDALLGGYMHGEDTKVFVTGSPSPLRSTPKWISDLISSITVPVPLPGRAFGGLIRNFSLSDVHLSLPDLLAEPDTPAAQPQISAQINVLVALPEEMNFNIDVDGVRANAEIYYKNQKLGLLDLQEWQRANSTRIEPHGDERQPTLLIEAVVENAPVEITDGSVFSEVVEALLFGEDTVLLSIKADVDVQVSTALGQVTVRQVPAEGAVPVKPVAGGRHFQGFNPEIGSLQIVQTTESSLTIHAELNFTNPTAYSISVPYVDINILVNDTILGHATARNINVSPGKNTGIVVEAVWAPTSAGGTLGAQIGRELLSQYISGFNTTLTLKTHKGTIPSQPIIGKALEVLEVVLPTPRLRAPKHGDGDGDEDGPDDDTLHFIQGATMHVISSTAVFNLFSPFSTTTLYITYINATAFYEGDTVGRIFYGEEFDAVPEEFAVPPGASTTPRLPVDWSLGSVGYEALKRALGGTLKLSAWATVGVRIGRFEERVWYKGRGIGAHVRL